MRNRVMYNTESKPLLQVKNKQGGGGDMMANSQTVMLVIRSARPTFRNNRDKVAFVVHASFVTSGFRLVAIGRPAFAADALTSSPTHGSYCVYYSRV